MRRTLRKQEETLRSLGVELPKQDEVAYANIIRSQAALREIMIQRAYRNSELLKMKERASECTNAGTCHVIPQAVFRTRDSSPLRPEHLNFVNLIIFDEADMWDFIRDECLELFPIFSRLRRKHHRVQLWTLCVLYNYGGSYIGEPSDSILNLWELSRKNKVSPSGAPFGLCLVLKSNTEFMAVTPRHPILHCLIEQVKKQGIKDDFLLPESLSSVEISKAGRWSLLSTACQASSSACCSDMSSQPIATFPAHSETAKAALYIKVLKEDVASSQSNVPEVTVHLEVDHDAGPKSTKTSLWDQMRSLAAYPGWLCTRCLNWADLGTFSSCRWLCPKGYYDIICRNNHSATRKTFPVNITVRLNGRKPPSIPRIIHQTWFEPISINHFPQMARLQRAWMNSGWEYRFYDDNQARNFIVENYPRPFAEAYDSLIHGAYKADLFRYLVLLKEGGVYADMDVLLETSLDTLVTPSMSFFVPRDLVAEYAGQPFCLWNGFIGSAPGHPFLVRTVERLISLIQERADLFDMERDICQRSDNAGDMEFWKVRAQPLLFLSGPCALGVSVNDALGQPSLAPFDIGWINLTSVTKDQVLDYGDALILAADKYDLGSFRLSDPQRLLIVASTDLDGLDSKPTLTSLRQQSDLNDQSRPPHYSDSKRGVSVWGTSRVYNDDLVSAKCITINVDYKN